MRWRPAETGPGANRHVIARRLTRFYTWCADADTAELTRLAGTIEAWWPQIEAFLQTAGASMGPVTLFMAVFEAEGVLVLMDTLATLDGSPYLFTTKATPIPHMQVVMVGTGSGELADRWSAFLRNRVRALDVEMLDRHTPAILRKLWSDLGTEHDVDGQTATIYHFGVVQDGTCHGYAYRSTAGFSSESLVRGLITKPTPDRQITAQDFDGLPAMVSLAEEIRAEQLALPAGARIDIGGDLMLIRLAAEGLLITRVHRFDDFQSAWNRMCGEPADTGPPIV